MLCCGLVIEDTEQQCRVFKGDLKSISLFLLQCITFFMGGLWQALNLKVHRVKTVYSFETFGGGVTKGSACLFITHDFRSLQREESRVAGLLLVGCADWGFFVTLNVVNSLSLLSGLQKSGSEGCSFSCLVLVRQGEMCPTAPPCPCSCLDGEPVLSAMRTNHCSHLPGVPPECPRPPAPDGKSLPGSSGALATSCPQYVMQVSSKDGQLLSSVVRTLAVQRYVGDRRRDRPLLLWCG